MLTYISAYNICGQTEQLYIHIYVYYVYEVDVTINPGSIHNNIFFQFSIFFSISKFYQIIALH